MQPLEGITVVDATQALVGPLATQTLGDLGAEVIKIEHPANGDLTRAYTPRYNGLSAYFVSLNRNKRSLTLDLTSEDGQDILHDLLEEADVFMQNFSPGDAEKFAADYDTVAELNDEIVYCDVSGYGEDSPYSGQKAFDIVLQGRSGIMSVTGTENQPARVGISVADISGAMTSLYAILTAIYHRERTGEGEHIELAMLDSSFQFLFYHVTNFLASGENPQRMGTRHPNLMPYQAFETADGFLVVGVISEGHWEPFCRAIDREEWIDREEYATFTDRVSNRADLDAKLDELFAERSTDEWMECLNAEGVPSTPLNTVEDIVNDPHIEQNDMLAEMEHPDLGTFRSPNNPVKFENLETDTSQAPPRLGEHTEEVLSELGYNDEEIDRFVSDGVV
ncbi:CoA transferase [Natronomonas sp. CBA1123]|uniref:CaiB/BaiF CoA transferase family protein n=1 Tax=Natronomonas sp. CBA1123 TaxID=2668070 RepID=UPI0012EA870F|nr:CoA transferase [Natronomonas sp. CBA1123]MUV85570.1 CoA transferase [Natronomonas sp. CBA1123]